MAAAANARAQGLTPHPAIPSAEMVEAMVLWGRAEMVMRNPATTPEQAWAAKPDWHEGRKRVRDLLPDYLRANGLLPTPAREEK